MANNDEVDRSLDEFIEYAEERLGGRLTEWQRAMLTDVYNRYGDVEVHVYVDKADREYDKVDDELSDLVDEFLSSPAKGRPVVLDLGDLTDEARKDLTDKVRTAIGEAGYPVEDEYTGHMDDLTYIDAGVRDVARQLVDCIDEDTVGALDDHTLGRLVDLVNEEWSSRGNLTPKDTEQLNSPQQGKAGEADATTRAYAGQQGAYLGALLANGFTRDEAMSMVMFELNADLVRDIHGLN